MIIKDEDRGIFVLFGFGNIAVDTGAVEDRGPNKPTDVILSQLDEARPIGTIKQNEVVCTDDLKNPVILRFSKPESVDVVISALLQVKESLKENSYEASDFEKDK